MINIFRGVSYFAKYCWKYNKIYIIFLFLQQIISSAYIVVSLVIPKYIINMLFLNKNIESAVTLIVIQITLTLIYSFFDVFLKNRILLKRMLVFKQFQLYLGDTVMKADYAKVENPEYLDTRSKAYKFLYGNGSGFGQVLESGFSIIGSLITLLGIASILGNLNPLFIILLIGIVLINTFFDAKYKRKNITLNLEKVKYERRSMYFTNIFSDFRYGKEIRANCLSDWLLSLYSEQLDSMQAFYEKIAYNNIIGVIVGAFIYSVQQILLYGYILIKVIQHIITVGDFTMYLNCVLQFTSTLKIILSQIIDLRQCTDYFSSYEEYISINNCKIRTGNLKPPIDKDRFEIEFRNVSYRYSGQSFYALKNVNVKIQSNSKIAIVGENGSGKSTFIKLLLRIYEPTEGNIYINGINIQNIDYEYYSKLFASVFQDYKLFSMSIYDNITLGKKETEKSNIKQIFDCCGMSKKIESLEDGLETYIYKDYKRNGFEPSGGEGQKIALVRALYKNTPIAILDEPTSALDPKAEAQIYGQFDSFFNNKLVLYISHRFAVTKFCDKILIFMDGKIVEEGTHKELINKGGKYAELYKVQADYYK